MKIHNLIKWFMWSVATAICWEFTPKLKTLGKSLINAFLKVILRMFFRVQFFNVMENQNQNEVVASARGLAKFFAVDISIKVFGQTIWEYHFPPKN